MTEQKIDRHGRLECGRSAPLWIKSRGDFRVPVVRTCFGWRFPGSKAPRRGALQRVCAFFLILIAVPVSAQTGGPRGERLIPAAFTQKKDALGFTWNLQHNGVLGRTSRMMIGNGMVLNVNLDGTDVELDCSNIMFRPEDRIKKVKRNR